MSALDLTSLDFAWDRPETALALRERLAAADEGEWLRLASWIMREARVDEVWQFLTLRQVSEAADRLIPRLGRRRALWAYLLRTARELGRI